MSVQRMLTAVPVPRTGRIALILIGACAISSCGGSTNVSGILSGPFYSVGGTVSGLAGSGLTLQVRFPQTNTNGTCAISRAANGSHSSFCLGGASGEQYSFTVLLQPSFPSQTCVVTNGSGTIGNADITNVDIACTTSSSRFAYVASTSSNSIAGYSIDATTGALTPMAQSPFAAAGPRFVAVAPSGQQALVGDGNSPSVSVYAIDAASGTLTSVTGSPFAAGNGSSAAAIDPTDGFIYVTNLTDGTVSAYSYNASNGALTAVASSPFAAGRSPSSVSMTLDRSLYALGQFVYVANNGSNNVSAYVADSSKGSLTTVKGSPFATGNAPTSVAVDPSSQFVYVTNQMDGTISALKIDLTSTNPGALAPVPGSPFAAGSSPVAIALDAYDRFAYVANRGDGTISGYAINTATGALSPIAGSPFAAGTAPSSVVVDNLGKFLYAANASSNTISVYAIDATSGALTPIAGSPIATVASPVSIALSDQ